MSEKNISIYVHWPFCSSKCPYCDFNSHIKRDIDNNEWGIALITELNYLFNKYLEKKRKLFFKIYFFWRGDTIVDGS